MHRFIAGLALLACTSTAFAQHDPAYVDSPAGRAIADPARADGASPNTADTPATAISQQAMPLRLLAQASAAARQQPAPDTQTLFDDAASLAPTQTGPGPVPQLQSAVMQDAAQLIDAGIQRGLPRNTPVKVQPYSAQAVSGAAPADR